MNPIVTPASSEISPPAPPTAKGGSGPATPQGSRSQSVQPHFSSVFAHAQNTGQKPPAANTPTSGRGPFGNSSVEGEGREDSGSEQTALVVSTLTAPAGSEGSILFPSHPEFPAVIDGQLQPSEGETGAVPTSALGSSGVNIPERFPSVKSSDETLSSNGIPTQKSDFSITTGVYHKEHGIDAGQNGDSVVLALRQPTGSTRQGSNDSLSNAQVSNAEIAPPFPAGSTAAPVRIGEPVAGSANTQSAALPEGPVPEVFVRQAQPILGSYLTNANSIPGLRVNGVDNGMGDIAAKPNVPTEIDAGWKSVSATSALITDDAGSQDFGLDQGESQFHALSRSQQPAAQVSGSGGTSLFADMFEGNGGTDVASSSRSGSVGERPSLLPSSLPQRLQMDLTLADDSRVQIDVAVQQRQVSAHLVTDQTLFRNLAVQHEGQLLGQLADAGLELRDFGAHVFDRSASGHRQSRDDLHHPPSEWQDPDGFHDGAPRELIAGMSGERGLHFVA